MKMVVGTKYSYTHQQSSPIMSTIMKLIAMLFFSRKPILRFAFQKMKQFQYSFLLFFIPIYTNVLTLYIYLNMEVMAVLALVVNSVVTSIQPLNILMA